MDLIREELSLLWSSTEASEFEWGSTLASGEDVDEQKEWEAALKDEAAPLPSRPPRFSLRLDPLGAFLNVEYNAASSADVRIVGPSLLREEQVDLSEELARQLATLREEDNPFMVFGLFTGLREWLLAHPLAKAPAPPPPHAAAVATTSRQPDSLQLKVALLWSHHLLATGKRKHIVQWSVELELWGISKPGYPGVIVVEGVQADVDEFLQRIKRLQWQALQVRCEVDGVALTPPSGTNARHWALRGQAQLAPVLGPEGKICVREVEGLGEVADLMTRANLEEVFRTAMKL